MESCNFYQTFATYATAYKQGIKIAPKGILIHSTGAQNPALKRWVNDPVHLGVNPNDNYFSGKNDDRQVCPHAVFGLDKDNRYTIEQILPYDVRCWGCGSGKNGSYNVSHIQIEIAEPYDMEDEDYFYSAMKSVAEWCADLMLMYPEIKDITTHAEAAQRGYASNHGDPVHWWIMHKYSIQDFRAEVERWLAYKRELQGNKPENPKVLYKVQVGAFENEQNARNYAKELKEKYGLDCFVVYTKGNCFVVKTE